MEYFISNNGYLEPKNMVFTNMPYKEELTVIRVVDSLQDRSVPQI